MASWPSWPPTWMPQCQWLSESQVLATTRSNWCVSIPFTSESAMINLNHKQVTRTCWCVSFPFLYMRILSFYTMTMASGCGPPTNRNDSSLVGASHFFRLTMMAFTRRRWPLDHQRVAMTRWCVSFHLTLALTMTVFSTTNESVESQRLVGVFPFFLQWQQWPLDHQWVATTC